MARILVAEDEEALRALTARALRDSGHEVVTAVDGAEALDIVTREEGRFDLLLTDIKMPLMDGIALALATARDYPRIIILLMTAYADQRERASSPHQHHLVRIPSRHCVIEVIATRSAAGKPADLIGAVFSAPFVVAPPSQKGIVLHIVDVRHAPADVHKPPVACPNGLAGRAAPARIENDDGPRPGAPRIARVAQRDPARIARIVGQKMPPERRVPPRR
jgi:two-component system cell cycle response regulator CpdR